MILINSLLIVSVFASKPPEVALMTVSVAIPVFAANDIVTEEAALIDGHECVLFAKE